MAEAKQLPGLSTSLDVNLVTPKGVVAHQAAQGLTAPGELGEFELLPGHVPFLAALKPGVLTISDKTRARYAVSSGYLRVDPTGAIEVLVEQAVLGGNVDVDKARAELKEAEAELSKWGDKPTDGDWKVVVNRVAWAQARLDAAAQS
jgi:F-type H+-transporting ATPase subunit epsilon